MNKALQKEIDRAEKILEQEREDLYQMVTEDGLDDYASPRDFLYLIEEAAKYKIRSLDLPEHLLEYYLNKVCDIYGPYSEDQPHSNKNYYDNDFYLSV